MGVGLRCLIKIGSISGLAPDRAEYKGMKKTAAQLSGGNVFIGVIPVAILANWVK